MFWKRRHLLFVSQIKPVAFEKKFNPAHYFCSRAAQITLIMINVEEELRVLNKSKMRKTPKMRMERERERKRVGREEWEWESRKHDMIFLQNWSQICCQKEAVCFTMVPKLEQLNPKHSCVIRYLWKQRIFFCLITLLSKQMRKYDTGVLDDTELSWMTTSFRSWSPRWN